jgi:diguanylate cyclase
MDFRTLVRTVSINLSPQDLLNSTAPDHLIAALRQGAPLDRWTVELTETAPDLDAARSLAALTRLRLHGVGVAIDDFGSGASSFSRLFEIPFTELKLDRVVVALLGTADEDVVRSTIALGRSRGIVVVAEGIERAHELDRLRSLGCDVAQGYLLGRPAAPEDFLPSMTVTLQPTAMMAV